MRRCVYFLLLSTLFCACQSGSVESEFPAPAKRAQPVSYAKHFEIAQDSTGWVVDIFYGDTKRSFRVANTESREAGIASMQPAESVACLSTTHIALLDKAGAMETLRAVAFSDLVRNKNARVRIDSGDVVPLTASMDSDFETLVALHPDVFLVYPFGKDDYSRLENFGIPCVPICEYLEPHPLGRAEWMKVVGLLTGRYEASCRAFEEIKKAYLSVREEVAARVNADSVGPNSLETTRPLVFTGSHDAGKWFAPSGDSYIAQFIRDAGGRYLFEDESGDGNIELEFEVLFERAFEADWWGKVVYDEEDLTLEEIREDDGRFTKLKSFRKGQIFYCNAFKEDYFGDGVVEPEVMLRDLVKIFHPDLAAEHQGVYFRKLERVD